MDKSLDNYRSIIEHVLSEYAKIPYAYGEMKRQLVFDRDRDHYLLLSVGWNKRRVHGGPGAHRFDRWEVLDSARWY